MKPIQRNSRKAISPIIATILIIAVTLIAAVAIGGFVFGLFGAQTNTAQVTAISTNLLHTTTAGTLAATCGTSAPLSTVSYITFTNVGSANTVAITISITYGGTQYTAALSTCTMTAGGTDYITVGTLGTAAPSAGQQFNGYIVTNNGAQVVFSGTFL